MHASIAESNYQKLMDPRHIKRLNLVQNLYSYCFSVDGKTKIFPNKKDSKLTNEIIDHLDEIDLHISKSAPKYPINKIAKTDLSILRLAVFELLIDKKEPTKVVINEAVEIAKELGNERSFAFINAVLGSINTTKS
ncbi:hypothetical protein COV58_00830 [Candidatus Roizmanbacteria bacterium CG11_big_fil_rev_8_21_14_0_20_36_8]|uniref:NusB/RsmB/TIM44 domain-containing protein n=2 Tax=Candidatus Roizmaniibacteriota TaxID=1752723 RepID=A0A2M6IV12_9BACT|nr:MAG: hypothetical protein COV58_00830 [Candidatus Roizmanbacteria bacterium CG11_big_fil_rev_8_21_14_0_20_36_8]PIZ66040.1 MAG: hypothetical protein COY14_01170 [Candidatus Roizmanbacteria bacterium CG_4_10_14_0_2_um_filter_36_9]